MRLALFGGTFDPIHLGHVEAALAAADAHSLDRVLVAPCGVPPHKRSACRAPYRHRLRMVELACKEDSRLIASGLDEPREGGAPNYSVDTVERALATLRFEEPLRFIVGADAFSEIGTWRDAERVASLVEFLVVGRPWPDANSPSPPTARAARSVECAHPASSSAVRHRAKIGGTLADLAPPDVCAYIWQHALYRPEPNTMGP